MIIYKNNMTMDWKSDDLGDCGCLALIYDVIAMESVKIKIDRPQLT